jgi:hypothetical protein
MVRAVPECLARDMIRKKARSSCGGSLFSGEKKPGALHEPTAYEQLRENTSLVGRVYLGYVFSIPSYLSKTFLKSRLSGNVSLILLPGVLRLYPSIGTGQVVSHHLAKRPFGRLARRCDTA